MVLTVVRRVLSLFLPEGLVLGLGVLAYLRWQTLQGSLEPVLAIAPYLIFGTGILLSWRFHRGRLLFALLVLAFADRALFYFGTGAPATTEVGQLVFRSVALLVPLDLMAFALLDRRGALTRPGLLRVAFVAAQLVIVAVLARVAPGRVADLLGVPVLPETLTRWTPAPALAVAAFVGAFVVFALRAVRLPDATRRGFLWSLAAAFLAVHTAPDRSLPVLFFATGGLILVVSAIESSHFMAFRDELTGLPARRAFNDALLRLGGFYTVAMVDVDHFKQVNDRHGHDVGDQVLRMVAARLDKVSGGGRAFRYGGEEFAVLYPGKMVEEIRPHLDELRESVEKSKFTLRRLRGGRKTAAGGGGGRRPRKLRITVSIGAAGGVDGNQDADQVIEAADEALYRAKRAGRNRVRV